MKKNRFEVISAIKIGMIEKWDHEHLGSAVALDAVLLIKRDYTTNVRHKGILIVHPSDDPKKEMTLAKIVSALLNLKKQVENNKINLENTVYPLNIFV